MDQNEILRRVDHTVLAPTAVWEQVKQACDDGKRLGVASVCIPPRYVKKANDYVGNTLKICTVVGFPNGYSTPEVKVFETEDAIRNGADEIDMVINQGLAKEGDWEGVLSELRAVKASCKGRILKVIVEACRFTQEEKISLCRVVSMAGADCISPDMRVKAAGGIRTFEQAQALLEAGADRIGASALAALALGR